MISLIMYLLISIVWHMEVQAWQQLGLEHDL